MVMSQKKIQKSAGVQVEQSHFSWNWLYFTWKSSPVRFSETISLVVTFASQMVFRGLNTKVITSSEVNALGLILALKNLSIKSPWKVSIKSVNSVSMAQKMSSFLNFTGFLMTFEMLMESVTPEKVFRKQILFRLYLEIFT